MYLLLLSTLHVSPGLQGLTHVHAVHGDLDLPDHVMFGEAVEVKHLKHQGLPSQLGIRDLEGDTGITTTISKIARPYSNNVQSDTIY